MTTLYIYCMGGNGHGVLEPVVPCNDLAKDQDGFV